MKATRAIRRQRMANIAAARIGLMTKMTMISTQLPAMIAVEVIRTIRREKRDDQIKQTMTHYQSTSETWTTQQPRKNSEMHLSAAATSSE